MYWYDNPDLREMLINTPEDRSTICSEFYVTVEYIVPGFNFTRDIEKNRFFRWVAYMTAQIQVSIIFMHYYEQENVISLNDFKKEMIPLLDFILAFNHCVDYQPQNNCEFDVKCFDILCDEIIRVCLNEEITRTCENSIFTWLIDLKALFMILQNNPCSDYLPCGITELQRDNIIRKIC